MSCPPKGEPHRCYRSKKRKCVSTNPWIQWLIINQGKGWTIREFSAKYKARPPRYKSYEFKCNANKALGTSHDLSLNHIHDPTEFYSEQKYIKPLTLYNARRAKITKEFKLPVVITVAVVKRVMTLVDKYYFDGSLLKEFAERGITVTYKLSDERNNSSMITQTNFKNNKVDNIVFKINKTHWVEGNNPKRVDGIVAPNRKTALVLTCEHELLHAIINVFDSKSAVRPVHHGPMFTLLNNRIFGHSESVYTYQKDFCDVEVD